MFLNKIKKYITLLSSHPRYFFNVSGRKLKEIFPIDYYLFRNGFAFYPTIVHIEVTHHCNLHCLMCTLYARDEKIASCRSRLEEKPLDINMVKKLLRSVASFKPLISLTGGEPLLYRHIDDIFRMTRQMGLDCCVTSNGVFLEKHAEAIVDNGVVSIMVSLDASADIHDELRGAKGTFKSAVEGIRKVDEIKRAKGVHAPRVKIVPCITNKNYRDLPKLLDELRDLDIGIESVTVSHLWFWPKEIVDIHKNNDELKDFKVYVQNTEALAGIDTEALAETINSIKKKRYPFPVNIFPDLSTELIEAYYTDPAKIIKERCIVPWREVMILPWGEVIPCLDYSYGSLREAEFKDIWNSSKAKHFRALLKKHKSFPSCRRCCGLFTM